MLIKFSLRKKIIYFIVMILLLLGLSLTLTSVFQQRNILTNEFQKRGSSLCKSLVLSSVLSILLEDKKNLQNLVNEMQKEKDVSYVIISDPEGKVLAQTEKKIDIPIQITEKAVKTVDLEIESFKSKGQIFFEFRVPIITQERTKKEILTEEFGEKEKEETGFTKIGIARLGMFFGNIQLQTNLLIGKSFLLMLLIVSICISLAFYLLSRMIIIPIENLIGVAEIAAEKGDLTQLVKEIKSKDEIGMLIAAFNKMIESLHNMVFQVSATAEKIANSAQQLSSSTQEVNAFTHEVSSSIQQVTKGATVQAERVEETFEIMGKSAVSLKQMVANAQTTSKAVGQTVSCAESGRISAQESIDKISRLTNTVMETAKIIQGLGEKSQAIGEITETITSIADQTNLLSLNAAIEAARAGEAGRGFAVVAEEVRKLAEGSAGAVRKIGGLIKSIQTETSHAVTAIETSFKEVQEGKAHVAKIADILVEINSAAGEAAKLADNIAQAGQERVNEIERLVKAVNEVAAIAKEYASTAEEVSSSTEEQTVSMQEMSTSTQELARISMDLKELVGKFKLKEIEKK